MPGSSRRSSAASPSEGPFGGEPENLEGEEILVTINLSSRPWSGSVDIPEGRSFDEVSPEIRLPVQPGGVVPERPRREVELPTVDLDPFRVFVR